MLVFLQVARVSDSLYLYILLPKMITYFIWPSNQMRTLNPFLIERFTLEQGNVAEKPNFISTV